MARAKRNCCSGKRLVSGDTMMSSQATALSSSAHPRVGARLSVRTFMRKPFLCIPLHCWAGWLVGCGVGLICLDARCCLSAASHQLLFGAWTQHSFIHPFIQSIQDPQKIRHNYVRSQCCRTRSTLLNRMSFQQSTNQPGHTIKSNEPKKQHTHSAASSPNVTMVDKPTLIRT
jgi:hypothetical protein